jgi:hypothetical protein
VAGVEFRELYLQEIYSFLNWQLSYRFVDHDKNMAAETDAAERDRNARSERKKSPDIHV